MFLILNEQLNDKTFSQETVQAILKEIKNELNISNGDTSANAGSVLNLDFQSNSTIAYEGAQAVAIGVHSFLKLKLAIAGFVAVADIGTGIFMYKQHDVKTLTLSYII